jgi:hypothetical protein
MPVNAFDDDERPAAAWQIEIRLINIRKCKGRPYPHFAAGNDAG